MSPSVHRPLSFANPPTLKYRSTWETLCVCRRPTRLILGLDFGVANWYQLPTKVFGMIWLPLRDSNPDMPLQRRLSYR